jgi:hypothetical protein
MSMTRAERLLKDADDAKRWARAFMLLSMPRVARFLPEMNVPTGLSRLCEISEAACRDFEEVRDGDIERLRSAFTVALQRAEAAWGESGRDDFVSWVEQTFPADSSGDKQAFLWSQVLIRFGVDTQWLSNTTITPRKQVMIVEAVRKDLIPASKIGRRIDEADQEIKTPWEEHLYAVYAEDCSPLDYLVSIFLRIGFRQVWSVIRAQLDEKERATLFAWMKERGATMGIAPDLLQLPPKELTQTQA